MSDRAGTAQLTAEKPPGAAGAWRRAAFSWDGAVLLALSATIGIYAGIAAGVFAGCIRFVQIVLFRFPELGLHLARVLGAELALHLAEGAACLREGHGAPVEVDADDAHTRKLTRRRAPRHDGKIPPGFSL